MLAALVAIALTQQVDISAATPTGNERIVAGRLHAVREPVVHVHHRLRFYREQHRLIEVEVPVTTTVMVPQQQTTVVRKWVPAPTAVPQVIATPQPAPAPMPSPAPLPDRGI